MIFLFNRKELLVTNDMTRFGAVRDALDGAGVEHRYRIKDLTRREGLGRRGTFGMSPTFQQMEYTVFVHARDYERAKSLL